MGKHFEPEYKDYICRLVVEDGRKVSELSRELGLSATTLYKWTRYYRKKLAAGEPAFLKPESSVVYKTQKDLEKEIEQLQKEIARKDEENDILRKAMHVFNKVQK